MGDLAMSNTLESLMPSPPPMSHLYLKHCEGRELTEDAVTPRDSEADKSDDEELIEVPLGAQSATGAYSIARLVAVAHTLPGMSAHAELPQLPTALWALPAFSLEPRWMAFQALPYIVSRVLCRTLPVFRWQHRNRCLHPVGCGEEV